MKTYLDCIPCFLRQALAVARHVKPQDPQFHKRVITEICRKIPERSLDLSPPMMAEVIHNWIREETGISDLYAEEKATHVRQALELEPRLRAWIEQHPDRLEAAVRVAIAGNIMDLGANPNFNLDTELNHLESVKESLEGFPQLREALEQSDEVLYIGDNASEAVFDQLLIEELSPRKVTFATRGVPILDDITEDLARKIGLDSCATVISSGSPIPGTDLNRVTPEFRTLFEKSPLVIAKGQGNFESLSDANRPIFFLFKVKCTVVALETGRPIGSSIVYPGGTQRVKTSEVPAQVV